MNFRYNSANVSGLMLDLVASVIFRLRGERKQFSSSRWRLYCVQLHGTHRLLEIFSSCDSLALNYNQLAPVRMVLLLAEFHKFTSVLKQRYQTKKSYTWNQIFDKLSDWSREQGGRREHRRGGDRIKGEIYKAFSWVGPEPQDRGRRQEVATALS